MDQKQIQQLRKTLLDEKAVLEQQLNHIAKKNPMIKGDWTAVTSDLVDPSDTLDEKAQNVTSFEERRAVEQSLELRLKEIEATLQQLEQGTYGICSNCGSPIDKKRLQAMSVVKMCFDCATKTSLA